MSSCFSIFFIPLFLSFLKILYFLSQHIMLIMIYLSFGTIICSLSLIPYFSSYTKSGGNLVRWQLGLGFDLPYGYLVTWYIWDKKSDSKLKVAAKDVNIIPKSLAASYRPPTSPQNWRKSYVDLSTRVLRALILKFTLKNLNFEGNVCQADWEYSPNATLKYSLTVT